MDGFAKRTALLSSIDEIKSKLIKPRENNGQTGLFSDEEFNEQRLLRERRELADRRTEERRAAPVQQPMRTDGLPQSTIEQKFPHIAKKLTALWRSAACTVYLSGLTVADRPGRQGFPLGVMEDLLMLYEINDTLISKPSLEKAAAATGDWGGAVRREHK